MEKLKSKENKEKHLEFKKNIYNLQSEIINQKLFDNNGKISKTSLISLDNLIKNKGRKNIVLNKNTLNKLGKYFGFNYSKLNHIGPKLASKIHKEALKYKEEQKIKSKLETKLKEKLGGNFVISTALKLRKLKNNKEGLEELYHNFESFLKYSVNLLENTKYSKSKIIRAATTIFLGIIERAAGTTVHEVAHSDKATFYGAETTFGTKLGSNKHTNNIFKVFLSSLNPKNRPYTTWTGNITNKQHIDISGAGITANHQLAEQTYENSLYSNDGKFDIVDSVSYLNNKTYLLKYALMAKEKGDDPLDVLNLINKEYGTNYKLSDLQKYAVLSLASGGVLTSLKEGYDFIFKGKNNTELIGFKTPIGEIYWPEFQTYLNKNNISFQIGDYVKLPNGNILKFQYEQNVMGEKGREFTFGGKYFINPKLDIEGDITIGNKGQNLQTKITYKVSNNTKLFIMGSLNNGYTNHGHRNNNGQNYITTGVNIKF